MNKSSLDSFFEEMQEIKGSSEETLGESFDKSLYNTWISQVEENSPAHCMLRDFTDDEYFNSPGYSASLIKLYIKNPSMVFRKGFKQGDREIKDTKQKMLGSAIHRIVLEDYEIRSFDSILTKGEREKIRNMIHGLSQNAFCLNVLKSAEAFERAIFWNFECRDKSLSCKAKVDLVTKNDCLVELKTVPTLEDIGKQTNNFRYDLQLSFYKYGWEKVYNKPIKEVFILAMETNPPYECHCFSIPDYLINRGRYGGEIYRLSAPGWENIIEEMHFEPRKRFSGNYTTLEV